MQTAHTLSPWRVCVAPMLDWTDRHCRTFHRLLTRHTRLYTEMVTTGALLHGDVARHLDFGPHEHPVALQLGGSEPRDLAHAARLAAQWGYDEVNLNCGCPSERVQRGAFGACLMNEPGLVADGIKAMQDAVPLPITVKHRIGLGKDETYALVRDFVGEVAHRGGARVFIVHARNAWLEGLSPKENREIPPLRYEVVHRLKQDFPDLTVVLNGGLDSDASMAEQLRLVDGVMIGRRAYQDPWCMRQWDRLFWGDAQEDDQEVGEEACDDSAISREHMEWAMVEYMERQMEQHGTPWPRVARHMLGLWNGASGARRWRRVWSDHSRKDDPVREVWDRARAARGEAVAHSL